MTPEEINEAVARKLGWSPPGPPPDSPTWKKPDGSYDFVPDYSTDIKAAWEIVDKYISESGWDFSLVGGERYGGIWQANFLHDQILISHEALTAPMAIALAFLKLP